MRKNARKIQLLGELDVMRWHNTAEIRAASKNSACKRATRDANVVEVGIGGGCFVRQTDGKSKCGRTCAAAFADRLDRECIRVIRV